MCEQKDQPAKLFVVRSVTERRPGKRCCNVNDGVPHTHCIRAENQRRERVHIRGSVNTRSATKQLSFTHSGNTRDEWKVDFLAYGQQVSVDQASVVVGAVHSPGEDIEAHLEYQYDDPFSVGYTGFSLTIPVKL